MTIGARRAMAVVVWSILVAGAGSAFRAGSAEASPVSGAAALGVVATGDSLTVGYAPERLQRAFDVAGVSAEVGTVATSGCNSARYVGEKRDPFTVTYRDYAAEVLDLDPDVIIFMLGTNDALSSIPAAFGQYTERITGVFDRFDAAVNSRGIHPVVFVSTLLPILSDDPQSSAYAAGQLIDGLYNPWLHQQAGNYGFELIDINARIQTVDDWQDLYSPDGIHLWGQTPEGLSGYTWLAGQIQNAVTSVIPAPPTPGDADGDNDVDMDDFVIFKRNFGIGTTLDAGDFDLDDDVDLTDFVLLKTNFGTVATTDPPPVDLDISGDADGDGDVDMDDFVIFKQNYGTGTTLDTGDFDGDGDVDVDDLVVLKKTFNAPAPAVPEPATLVLMAAAGLPLLIKRTRSAR